MLSMSHVAQHDSCLKDFQLDVAAEMVFSDTQYKALFKGHNVHFIHIFYYILCYLALDIVLFCTIVVELLI